MRADDWDPVEAAAAGAAHLDEVFPGWEDRVVLSRLKMQDGHPEIENGRPCGCIGAQLDVIWAEDRGRILPGRWFKADWLKGYRRFKMRQVDHGLILPQGVRYREARRLWGRLNAAWRREIRRRRSR